jgi:putative transposase
MNGRFHTREFKIQLCKQIESGEKRPAQICREHKLAESSLLKWRKEYLTRGEAAFTSREPTEIPSEKLGYEAKIAELERFCGQLALENSVLKKALAAAKQASISKDVTS